MDSHPVQNRFKRNPLKNFGISLRQELCEKKKKLGG